MTALSNASMDLQKSVRAWLMMARIPFHTVGVFPFCLGAVLAWRLSGYFSWGVFVWGTLAVVLIMLSTYLAGEYYDLAEDRLSGQMERNPFTGGSQALVYGMVPRHYPRVGSYVALSLAGAIGLLLQFHYRTGPWTIPLGLLGMVSGFFYSTRPIRWVNRGIGEIIIGFSYGWLPIAASFYIQTGELHPLVHLMSLPVGLSIFNVILINEFPDYPADLSEGKKTLTVRLGKKTASYIYALASMGGVALYPLAVTAGLSAYTILLYLPAAALSFMATAGMLTGRYNDRKALERMCGITIAINWLFALTYLTGIWIWGL